MFSRKKCGLQSVGGDVLEKKHQLSNIQKPDCFFYVGDCISKSDMDSSKPQK